MEPTICVRCKKNAAVIFITKIEGNETKNEGLCLKCARELHIKPVDDIIAKMGLSDEDLDSISGEAMNFLGGMEAGETPDDADTEEGKTATFPLFGRLFGNMMQQGKDQNRESPHQGGAAQKQAKEASKQAKTKYLDSYCIDLTARAAEGKLDAMIGREEELERVIQILNRRQKNNPCLIGEPGVGKSAIAEGLAQKIAMGSVPFKLQNKRVFLLDLTSLVAGTQFRGQFESRMKGLIEDIRRAGNVIHH